MTKPEKMYLIRSTTNLFQLVLLFKLILFFTLSVAQNPSMVFCGKIRIQTPFSLQNSNMASSASSPFNQMLLCKSETLYFRTSIGLFPVSSIDYRDKTLTISHTTCSSSLHFVSPSLLSAGFPSLSQPNSLLLFNCLNHKKPMSSFPHNCSIFHGTCSSTALTEPVLNQPFSCWFVDDSQKLDMGFDPKDLNCSHYNRIYKDSSSSDVAAAAAAAEIPNYELGTRISFEIPDHIIPKVCDECTKPQGNCGVGLRCICYPKQCKDKVFSNGVSMDPFGNIFLYLFLFTMFVYVGFS